MNIGNVVTVYFNASLYKEIMRFVLIIINDFIPNLEHIKIN